MFLYLGPVLTLLSGRLARGWGVGAVLWNGLENELIDEINLNSFKSALSLPWTGDCLEGVVIELLLVILYNAYVRLIFV